MREIDVFEFAEYNGAYEDRPLKTALYKNGKVTGSSIEGFVIQAQFQVGDQYLLITDWDCPFEEQLEFHLLDAEAKPIHHQELGAPYATILLKSYRVVSDTSLECDLGGDADYKLAVTVKNNKIALKKFRHL